MTRLYYPDALAEGRTVVLHADHLHYLRNVLRQQEGGEVALFNSHDGEWAGVLVKLTKTQGEVRLHQRLRLPETDLEVALLFCPIKQDPLHYLIEKCTELGVTVFQPVLMERSTIHKINRAKLHRIAIEATQQCDRLSIPEVRDLRPLREVLETWSSERKLAVCAERLTEGMKEGGTGNLKRRVEGVSDQGIQGESGQASLIGPEGGISSKEREFLSRYPFVHFISLGKNILRAETAAVVATAKMVLG
jgi:16S rRNA (uracil1498-N3)-methyltransferase